MYVRKFKRRKLLNQMMAFCGILKSGISTHLRVCAVIQAHDIWHDDDLPLVILYKKNRQWHLSRMQMISWHFGQWHFGQWQWHFCQRHFSMAFLSKAFFQWYLVFGILINGILVNSMYCGQWHFGQWHFGQWHFGQWHFGLWYLGQWYVLCFG